MTNNTDKRGALEKNKIRVLPDWLYRLGIYLALLLVATLIQPGFISLISGWKLVALITALMLYTELSVLIKKYEHSKSDASDLIQAITAPGLFYLVISIWGLDSIPLLMGAGRGLLVYCFAFGILSLYIQIKAKDIQFTKAVLAFGISVLRSSVIMIMVGFIVYLMVTNPDPLHSKSVDVEYERWSPSRTINANYDDLRILNNEELFSGIKDKEKRLALFATIVDVESNCLGIIYSLKVRDDSLGNDVIAAYTDLTKTITIDEDYLASCTAEEMIMTAAHEVRHAYQHQLIDTYIELKSRNYKEAVTFLENFNVRKLVAESINYNNGNKDYYSYSSQFCERDARDYADKSCQEWKEKLAYNAELETEGINIEESEERLYLNEK